MTYQLSSLTQDEVNLIATALANRPWGEVNGLMSKIAAQVKHQDDEKGKTQMMAAADAGGGSGGPGPFRPK